MTIARPSDLLGAFRWVGLAYAGSAMFATLPYIVYLQAGAGVFWITAPLLVMLLLVLHFFYRQQEAQEGMRAALADIARREVAMRTRAVETTARHGRELHLSQRRFRGAFTYAAIGKQELRLLGAGGRVRWVCAHCSFFPGPAVHGAASVGKPCLIVQVQALERATAPDA